MNDIVFMKKDEAFKEAQVELAFMKELNEIVKDAYKKSCNGDWTAIDDLKIFDIHEGFYIHWALFEALARNLMATGRNERQVYEWFRDNYKVVLGSEFEIIKKKTIRNIGPIFG